MDKILSIIAVLATIITPALAQNHSLATSPVTQPATQPVTQPATAPAHVRIKPPIVNARGDAMIANQRRQIEQQKAAFQGLPVAGNCKLDELLQLTLVEGQLQCQQGSYNAPAGQQTRVKVEGSDAIWLVTNNTNMMRGMVVGPAAGVANAFITLQRYDWAAADREGFWQIAMNSFNGVSLNAQALGFNVNFSQNNNMVFLNVNDFRDGQNTNCNYQAATISQLQADHPEEVRKYLSPMLRCVTGKDFFHAGAADLYLAFTEVPADPEATRQVRNLLPDLDAEDFAIRDKASRELAKLGAGGVLAALRLDWDQFSVEQRARLDSFLATEGRRTIHDPKAARKNLDFLIDAMNDSDKAVATAAKHAIEDLAGHPIQIDGQPGTEKYNESLDTLWHQLKKELHQ